MAQLPPNMLASNNPTFRIEALERAVFSASGSVPGSPGGFDADAQLELMQRVEDLERKINAVIDWANDMSWDAATGKLVADAKPKRGRPPKNKDEAEASASDKS